MAECPHCYSEIDVRASVCRSCGADKIVTRNWRRIFLGFGIALIGILMRSAGLNEAAEPMEWITWVIIAGGVIFAMSGEKTVWRR